MGPEPMLSFDSYDPSDEDDFDEQNDDDFDPDDENDDFYNSQDDHYDPDDENTDDVDTSKKEEVGEDVAGSDLSSLAAMLKSSNLPQSMVNMMFQLIQNMENKEDKNQQPQAFRGQSGHREPVADSKVK